MTHLLILLFSVPGALAFEDANRLVVECPYSIELKPSGSRVSESDLKATFREFKPDMKKSVTCQYVIHGEFSVERKGKAACAKTMTIALDPKSASAQPTPHAKPLSGKISRKASLARSTGKACSYRIEEGRPKKPEFLSVIALYSPGGRSARELRLDCSPNGNRVICTRDQARF
jgi:hypothetical protein